MKLTSADTLKALMDQKGFNGERLGRYAGCSRQMISQLRNGSKKTCSPELATRIVEALQVPLDVLFEVSLPSKTRQRVNRKEAA